MTETDPKNLTAAERWAIKRTEENIAFFAAAIEAGHGFLMTSEPSTSREPGRINGLCFVQSHTPFARQVAERAERRSSTATV